MSEQKIKPPETCPRCASPIRTSIPHVGIQFECAAIALKSGHFSEALPCVMRQRDQLAAELQSLRAENAKLRQWGENLVRVGNKHIDTGWDEWTKAKVKP